MAELLEKRTRSSKTHSLGGHKFAWDGTIGSVHYQDNGWQEIDNEFLPVAPPWNWEMVKAGYHVRVKEDFTAGQIIQFEVQGETVEFQPMALEWTNDLDQIQPIGMPQNVTPLITNPIVDLLPGVPSHQGTIRWNNAYGSGIDFEWKCQSTRLAKTLSINSLSDLSVPQQYILDGGNPVLRFNLIFDPPSNVDIVVDGQIWNQQIDVQTFKLIEFVKDGEVLWGFMPLRYWDSSEDNKEQSVATLEKRGNKLYISIRVSYDWLLNTTYPVFVDADIEVRVAASVDDATSATIYDTDISGAGNWGYEEEYGNFGGGGYYFIHYRWPVAIDAGATIGIGSYIRRTARSNSGNSNTGTLEVYDERNCEAFSNPKRNDARIADQSVAWTIGPNTADATYDSPEIKDLVQAWLDLAEHQSGDYFGVQLSTIDETYVSASSIPWDHDSAKAAILHIEYTVGNGDQELTASPVAVSSSVVNASIQTSVQLLTASPVSVTSSVVASSIQTSVQILTQATVAVSSSVQTAAVAGIGDAPLTQAVVSVSSSVVASSVSTGVQVLTASIVSVSSSVVNASLSGIGTAPLTASVVSVTSSVSTASIAGTGVAGLTGAVVAVTASVQTAALSGSGVTTLTAAVVSVSSSVQNAALAGAGVAPLTGSVVAVTSSVQAAALAGSGIAPLTGAVVAVISSVVQAALSGSGTVSLTSSPVAVTSSVINSAVANVSAVQELFASPIAVAASVQTATLAAVGAATLLAASIAIASSVVVSSIQTRCYYTYILVRMEPSRLGIQRMPVSRMPYRELTRVCRW